MENYEKLNKALLHKRFTIPEMKEKLTEIFGVNIDVVMPVEQNAQDLTLYFYPSDDKNLNENEGVIYCLPQRVISSLNNIRFYITEFSLD